VGSVVVALTDKKLATPPKWLASSVAYETIMGSEAYGVSSGASDRDVYGFCLPPKDDVFPHLRGEILGFGRQIQRFEQFQQHHITDAEARGGAGLEYDLTIFSIIKYFQLAMDNNPNIIDSLFTPQRCVLHCTQIGNLVRENRKIFLHKGAWHKFKGYAYAQIHKMETKTPISGSKRADNIAEFGFDVKFAYHVIRLIDEVEQVLTLGDLDIERDRERLKAVRRGDWTMEQVKLFFTQKEKELESAYSESKLPHTPDEAAIKTLLLQCLEAHYGSLKDAVTVVGREAEILRQIKALCDSV
jgi:uncharacterized protein